MTRLVGSLNTSTKKRDTTLNRGSRYSRVVPIMVGQGDADSPTPEGNGFTTLETRIELEIYEFENLDYLL